MMTRWRREGVRAQPIRKCDGRIRKCWLRCRLPLGTLTLPLTDSALHEEHLMRRALIPLAAMAACVLPVIAARTASVEDALNATTFRNIGPFRTAAWVTAIAVPEAPLREHLY